MMQLFYNNNEKNPLINVNKINQKKKKYYIIAKKILKKTNIILIKTWDNDEAAKDVKTYQTQEGSLKALDHIIKKYMRIRSNKKINPSKQTFDEVLDLFTNTLLFDKKFHQFALYNYGVSIKYHKKENVLDIVKLQENNLRVINN